MTEYSLSLYVGDFLWQDYDKQEYTYVIVMDASLRYGDNRASIPWSPLILNLLVNDTLPMSQNCPLQLIYSNWNEVRQVHLCLFTLF